MQSFIYVRGEKGRDRFLAMNYELIKSYKENHIYVFLNKEADNLMFDVGDDIEYIFSDTLAF